MKRSIITALLTVFFSATALWNAHPVLPYIAPVVIFALMMGLFLGKKIEGAQ